MAALLLPALALGGCAGRARILGQPPDDLPLPAGIEVVFNHRADRQYRSPIDGQSRSGDDLEALLLETIRNARQEILVAVQELSLPRVAHALVEKRRQGVAVRLILENTYSTPFSDQSPADLDSRQRSRHAQLSALADRNRDGVLNTAEREQGDALAILGRGGVPRIDDTADGSAGSGLMHHKFLVVDGHWLVTGSANFTASGLHGDPGAPRTRGNVNHLLRFENRELAGIFRREFERMWGDGPGGAPDSRFGLAKESGPAQTVAIGSTQVTVLFSPHRRRDPHHGLTLLEDRLAGTRRRLDMALFVFSAQGIADALARLQARGVQIRLLADPGFASRSFSEVLDLLGLAMPDRFCRLEAANAPWEQPAGGVGTPRLATGDKMHHKLAVIDDQTVITGSFNWSPAAAHVNDETLLILESAPLAAHFAREIDRMWQGAELGVTPRLQRKLERMRQTCGSGIQRASPASEAR